MRLEKSEKLLIEKLVKESIQKNAIKDTEIVDLIKLTGDASTRRYYRLTGDVNSYVVCIDDPAILEGPTSNFLITQSIFKKEGLRVPEILDSNAESGYILEEDLGNQTLLLELASATSVKEELDFYNNIIESLIKIHSVEISKYKKASFTKLFFNVEKLMQEVEFTLKFFATKFLEKDESDQRIKNIKEDFRWICQKLSAQQMVFTHRDLHSRNIMVKNKELIFIDFQDARMGIPQYDLVSLLEDSYYELVPENKEILVKKYWDEYLCKTKMQSSYNEYQELYDLMKIQRTFKAIGSFCYIYALRGDIRYLKYIGFAFEKLRTTIMKYDNLSKLKTNLSSIYYES